MKSVGEWAWTCSVSWVWFSALGERLQKFDRCLKPSIKIVDIALLLAALVIQWPLWQEVRVGGGMCVPVVRECTHCRLQVSSGLWALSVCQCGSTGQGGHVHMADLCLPFSMNTHLVLLFSAGASPWNPRDWKSFCCDPLWWAENSEPEWPRETCRSKGEIVFKRILWWRKS